MSLSATASDSDGKVVRVDYYEGTNWLISSGTVPFKALWSKVSVGAHSLFAVATDNAGATTVSEPVQFTVVPTNDDFVVRGRLSGTNCVVRVSNTFAAAKPGEPDHSGYPATHSLWWTYTAPSDGEILISAMVSSLPAFLSVYEGAALNALTEVASTDGQMNARWIFGLRAVMHTKLPLTLPTE